jgi:hypothetical protein
MVPMFNKRALNETDMATLRSGNVWKGEGPVGPDRLSHLTLTHIDFDGQIKNGEMMVMDVTADSVLQIFKTLFQLKFPITKIALMSDFGGDDELAMSANASNAFISRNIMGKSLVSLHSYGLAIDVNQIQNPYCIYDGEPGQKLKLFPKESSMGYLNRVLDRPGKPPRPGMVEPVVHVFRENGFTVWGGDWDDPLDYHHFQVPRPLAQILAKADFETGLEIFNHHKRYYTANKTDFLSALEKRGIDIKNFEAVKSNLTLAQ